MRGKNGKTKRRAGWIVAICLLLSLWTNGLTAFAASGTNADIPRIVEQVSSSVVAIIGKPTDNKNTENNRFNLAHGTGVIVKSNGVILTNAHVVKGMKNIVVVTSDGKTYPGKTTHFDEVSDLALVKIEAFGLSSATFASPNDIKVGETVMAIGTPISFALRNSVTVGIVSGLDRSVESKYTLIQTDAAINPGNSGGALVNTDGKVIGINSMKFVDYSVESMGFAIPVHTVNYVLEHFEKYGRVMRPYMGLELEESWEAVVGLPAKESLTVSYVDPDSPAAKGGIKQGDTIISFDQTPVSTIVEYNELMKKYLPKDTLRVTLQSEGQTVVRSVVLEEDESTSEDWIQTSDGSYIDNDRGKTKIGDSHYGWSMKYPAGLVMANQSTEGGRVMFGDAKGEFVLVIEVKEDQNEDMSVAALMRNVSKSGYGDTILEKRYVEREPNSYAKVVAISSAADAYLQSRSFLKGDKIYSIGLIVRSEDNYKNKVKLNSFIDLLDSFTISFDDKDTALKDISNFKEGGTLFANQYGLVFELPSGWEEPSYGNTLSYSHDDYDFDVSVNVTSASSGETLAKWTAREEADFQSRYKDDYKKVGAWQELEADGVPVKHVRYEWRMGGDKWDAKEVVYLIKDKYKYQINIVFTKDEEEEEVAKVLKSILDSVKVSKDEMIAGLGFIQDEKELVDQGSTSLYKNEKYKYSIRFPETWTSSSYLNTKDSARSSFTFTGGLMSVEADDKTGLDDVVKKLEQGHKKSNENDNTFTYEITDDATFAGGGKKISVSYAPNFTPYQQTEYVFRQGNVTYTITLKINEAVNTEANAARADAAVKSFKVKQ